MDIKKLIKQGVKFSLVGVVNTLIDMAVYFLLTLTAFFNTNYLFAQAISFSCGVANSLFMNKRFTFNEKGKIGAKRALMFIAINLVAMGVSMLALYLARDTLGFGKVLSKLISVVFSLGVNFTLNKIFVFKG